MRKFISVPKTLTAMYNDEYGNWNEQEHYIWNLTDANFCNLWECGAFLILNKRFNIMIDDFEEESIFYQKLYFCRNELFEELDTLPCKQEIEKLKVMIDYAIKQHTLLSFSF